MGNKKPFSSINHSAKLPTVLMKKILVFGILISALVACSQHTDTASPKEAINHVLDDWHEAAADGDFERYFGHFASDSAIFMGTDATERWTVAEFKPWSEPHFTDAPAWDFTPIERHIYISDEGETAWFDEVLDTPNLGPARGTGVLVKQDTAWKIAHYNLSIPIPNAIADTVVQQVQRALNDTTSAD